MKANDNIAVLHTKVEIHGTCDDQFTPVREAFSHNLDTGQDIGASVAVFVDGEPVVDLWGGHFDGTYTRPFERDTIMQGCSSTKTVTALCALVLADRGEIDLDVPVAKYWPEFAAVSLELMLFPGVPGGTRAAWWAGNGGSLSWIDPDAHMSIGFVPNRWISGPFEIARNGNLVRAAYASLGQAKHGARTSLVAQES
jgi:CubicO group peptidase (beta-lactamase class C family)